MARLSLLAVFAHPDDESCGPGATLAQYAQGEVEVTLLCVTKGEAGACGDDSALSPQRVGAIRVKELACACRRLGIQRWAVLGYPDGAGGHELWRRLARELSLWIQRVRPHVVITHYPEGNNGHPDHRAVSQAVTLAYLHADPAGHLLKIRKSGLEPWLPLKLYYAVPPDPTHGPASMNDCTVVQAEPCCADAKQEALRCHATQEPCWSGLIQRVQSITPWEERFCLAHSRVPRLEGLEHDLFAGVREAERSKAA